MRSVVAVAMFSLIPLTGALADVYRSVDAQGHVLYSDTPSPGAERVRVTSNSQRLAAQTSAPAGNPRPTAPSTSKSADSIHDQIEKDEAARTVQHEVAQTRADQCKKAQDQYQQSIQARRIYNTDASGERQYLSDAEAEQARVNAKVAMDDACKGQ
jgi:hypothetical protein